MSIMEQTRSSVERKESTGPLKNLQHVPQGRSIRFPDNIEAIGHYMKISIFEKHKFEAEVSTSPGSSSLQERTDILHSILLPMPSGLATTYAQNYDDSQALGPIGATVGATVNTDETLIPSIRNLVSDNEALNRRGAENIKKLAKNTFSNVKEELSGGGGLNLGVEFVEAQGGTIVGGALNGAPGAVIGGEATRAITAGLAGAGVARNPHMAVIYKTPNFRVFNFSWELRPRTYTESVSIAKMIHSFKYYSAPSFLAKSHMLKYPNQFGLSFKFNEFLFTMGTTVLKNFTVDYHGEGTPLYYDATYTSGKKKLKPPAVVKISTEFQEISILTKEGIEKRNR